MDPIPTKDLTADDVEELTRTTRELMLKELISLSQKNQNKPTAMPVSAGNGTIRASGVDATS